MTQEFINDQFGNAIRVLLEQNIIQQKRINQLEKTVKFLNRQDRRLAWSIIFGAAASYITAKEINKLRKEVGELKRMKGE